MVWVYDSPLTTSEQKVYKVLKRKLKEEDIAKTTVKILSLYAFLKKTKPTSIKEIRGSIFLDKQKSVPVFTEEQSKSILKALKKKGGASKYPLTDFAAKKGLNYAVTLVPEGVTNTVQSVYDLATSPVRIVEENVPFSDLLLESIHGGTETGVTMAGDIAEGFAGPFGAAIIAPATALAAGLASLISLGQKEKDFGQAVAHLAYAVPIIGSGLGKSIGLVEGQAQKLKEHPELADVIDVIPILGEFVTGRPTRPFSELTASLSPEAIQQKLKERATAELQKRGIPTSAEDLQAQAKARGMAELQKRGLPTSTEDLQAKAQARVTSELQKRLPSVPMTAPAAGGKRFSTQRRKHSKWPKTRRNKSAKV